MKIGIIVEGNGELNAFQALIPRINTPHIILHRPIRADLQPKCINTNAVAKSANAAVQYYLSRSVDLIVVLIDREDLSNPRQFKLNLLGSFGKLYPDGHFEIVVKNHKVENWLVSDVDALKASPKRFQVSPNFEQQVSPNKADNNPKPEIYLKHLCIKKGYDKGNDPTVIMEKQDPLRVARNSRSFRRFLRVVGELNYLSQSKDPI